MELFEQDGILWREGEHTPLTVFSNRKYTHHPVAAWQELRLHFSLRHLSDEQLTQAIIEYGVGRSSYCYYDCLDNRVIDWALTKHWISNRWGYSCFGCDKFTCDTEEDHVSFIALDERKRRYVEQIYLADFMCPQECYGGCCFPVICPDCFKLVIKKAPPSSVFDQAAALRGMIVLLEERINRSKRDRSSYS